MRAIAFAAVAILFISCSAQIQGSAAREPVEPVRQAFDVELPFSPRLNRTAAGDEMAYELHLTSFARDPLTVLRIQVLDASSGRVVDTLENERLVTAIGGPGRGSSVANRTTVINGQRAIVYLNIRAASELALSGLRHRIEFDVTTSTGAQRAAVITGETPVAAQALPVLGPPLRGGPWAAIYDPTLEDGHRRFVYAVGGRARIPGRHAIDWMRAGPADRADVANDRPGWDGDGAEVLAVADATVAAVRNDMGPQSTGGASAPLRLGDATGNYVALDIGDGRYAFYEHLAPGVAVRLGQRVRRGQVIGRLGATGQASRPHLHFHVADANSPLGAEGLPYQLAEGKVVGRYTSIAAFEQGERWQASATPLVQADAPFFPASNAVLVFD